MGRFLAAYLLMALVSSPLSGQGTERFDAWVTLADKGITSEAVRQSAYRSLEATFDSYALHRRQLRRTLPGLFDDHDIPLKAEYLEGIRRTGAEIRVQSRWLNGLSVLATRLQLQAIEALPFVAELGDIHAYVPKEERHGRIPRDPDLLRGPPPDPEDVYGWAGPQIRQLNLHTLHEAGFRGEGVRIGVIDTGFLLSHPVFTNASHPLTILDQWDFVDNDPVATPEMGDTPIFHEHGSLILGLMAANAPGELIGSAPEAEYILLKAEDDRTEYFLEEKWFVAALEFAEARGADVISSSVVLYTGYDPEDVDGRTSIMAQGWNLATGNGVIGLQGGGNSGNDEDPTTHHLLPPAGAPMVITVGAVDASGEIAFFSSDGLMVEGSVKPELLAWGRNTVSISPYKPGAFTTANGTSMATPVLAGGIACLLQAHPDWTLDQVRGALFESGDFFRENDRFDPLFIRGYGIPDLTRATGIGR